MKDKDIHILHTQRRGGFLRRQGISCCDIDKFAWNTPALAPALE